MAESYSACVARVKREAQSQGDAIRVKRNEMTREITRKWAEGFKALKLENDRLQRERDLWYAGEMQMIAEWLADAVVGCQR